MAAHVTLNELQAFALNTFAESIKAYADSITLDAYRDDRQYARDSHLREHLRGLAEHLESTAEDMVCPGS